jgi:hypothetical protein
MASSRHLPGGILAVDAALSSGVYLRRKFSPKIFPGQPGAGT